MATTKRNLTNKSNPLLMIDIIDLLFEVETDPQRRNEFTKILTREPVKREFGNRVIDKILENTNASKDRFGGNFDKYSDAYKESLVFKIYGKTDKVDLKLTEAMQSDLNVKGTTPTGVILGFVNPLQGGKAHGHITGARFLPVRDFFGLQNEELELIMTQTIKDAEGEAESALLQQLELQERFLETLQVETELEAARDLASLGALELETLTI